MARLGGWWALALWGAACGSGKGAGAADGGGGEAGLEDAAAGSDGASRDGAPGADGSPRDGAAVDARAPDAASGVACPGLTQGPSGAMTGSIMAAGLTRTYVLFVPANLDPAVKLPLIFGWQGDGGTGAGIRTTLALEAQGRAIFVYPDGINDPNGSWDLDAPAATNRDIALFDGLLARVSASYCIDSRRVFATGFSRGGFFTNHLACQRGDKLRAIAPQSGGGPYGANYNGDGQLVCPTAPVPALMIHGNADTTVPNVMNPSMVDGGWQSYRHWAYWNHAAPRAGYDFASDPVTPSPCMKARGLPADHPVEACFIDGLGHAPWTMRAPTVWNFFAQFQ